MATLGEARMASGDAAGAVRDFEQLAERQSEAAGIRYLLGWARLANGDTEGAKTALLAGLERDPAPDNLPSARLMTSLVSATEELEEKVAIVAALKAVQPEHPQVLDLEAQLAARQGDTARPVEIYRGLAGRFPGEQVWMVQLAKAQWAAGRREAYLDTLRGWLGGHPDDPAAQALLANGYLQMERHAEARAALERTLELAPDHASSLNNLAWLLREDDPTRALTYAQRARELRPEDVAVQDTLGTILLLEGRAGEALGLLQDAAEKWPTNPTIRYHYALALEQTGDTHRARRQVSALLQAGGDFPERTEAEELLARLDGAGD
jgi:Flp pilus assembly protein TadD